MTFPKNLLNAIYVCIAITILGYFANFAQNDYGIKYLVSYSLIGIFTIFNIYIFKAITSKVKSLTVGHIIFISLCILYYFFCAFKLLLPDEIVIPLFVILTFSPHIFTIYYSFIYRKNKQLFVGAMPSIFFEIFLISIFIYTTSLLGSVRFIGFGVLLVTCGISLPIFYITMFFVTLFKKNKSINEKLIIAIPYLYLTFALIGFVFKVQHWPGAIIFVYFSLIVVVCFSIYSMFVFKKLFALQSMDTIRKLTFVSCAIMGLYRYAAKNEIVPNIYSDEYPEAMEELRLKGNTVTTEGRAYEARFDKYRKNMNIFFDNNAKRK